MRDENGYPAQNSINASKSNGLECKACDGLGFIPHRPSEDCAACSGKGRVYGELTHAEFEDWCHTAPPTPESTQVTLRVAKAERERDEALIERNAWKYAAEIHEVSLRKVIDGTMLGDLERERNEARAQASSFLLERDEERGRVFDLERQNAELKSKLKAIENLPRYDVTDTDTSCGDADCCGGYYPDYKPTYDEDGDYVLYEELKTALIVPHLNKPQWCRKCGAAFCEYHPGEWSYPTQES